MTHETIDIVAGTALEPAAVAVLQPFSGGGSYLNFPGFFEEGEELLRASYGERNYERLGARGTLRPCESLRRTRCCRFLRRLGVDSCGLRTGG